jgi:hypothetical protein
MKKTLAILPTLALAFTGCAGETNDRQVTSPTRITAPPITATTTTEAAPDPLAPEDIVVEVVVLSQHCFGEAGCNVEFDLDVNTVKAIEKGESYKITYEVTGTDSDPYIDTFTITGIGGLEFRYEWNTAYVGTPSTPALTATVTRVAPN